MKLLDHIPAGLLQTPAQGLKNLLGEPTLIRIAGEREPSLFISVLLHGNETSGWNALRRFLTDQEVPRRSLIILIGNVDAAEVGARTLAGQTDFNRIWRGSTAEQKLVSGVREHVLSTDLFAAIDMHNNTGKNPHYAVITRATSANHSLARLFSDKAVYVDEPDTVLTRFLDQHAPSITLELGPVADVRSDQRGLDYLQRLILLDDLSDTEGELQLYRAIARVYVSAQATMGFVGEAAENTADITLTGGLEGVNFHPLLTGTEFGRSQKALHEVLYVMDNDGRLVTEDFLRAVGERVVLAREVTPAMFTTDEAVVRQDCLCYFMQQM